MLAFSHISVHTNLQNENTISYNDFLHPIREKRREHSRTPSKRTIFAYNISQLSISEKTRRSNGVPMAVESGGPMRLLSILRTIERLKLNRISRLCAGEPADSSKDTTK